MFSLGDAGATVGSQSTTMYLLGRIPIAICFAMFGIHLRSGNLVERSVKPIISSSPRFLREDLLPRRCSVGYLLWNLWKNSVQEHSVSEELREYGEVQVGQ